MGFRINTNIAALNSHQAATANNKNLDASLNRLSSGLRINTAADDASGLAIANSLKLQSSALGQAISNGNDAVALIQTADGALTEYSKTLDKIRVKATNAATDGQSTASRQAIQQDINKLLETLDTIAKTTSFNGQKLLAGTFTNKEFQMGAGANETIKLSIASAETSQIGQTAHGELTVDKLGENQLTLKSATTNKMITLSPVDLQYNNTASGGMGGIASEINKYTGETGITAKAVVKVETGAIAAGTTSADFAINGINIGSVVVDANDAGGTLQSIINSKTTQTGVTATRTADGQLEMTSKDGRAIKIDNLSGIAGNTDAQMTSMGKLDITQLGSSDFEIKGAGYQPTAAGADITFTGTVGIIQDSMLAKGSTIGSGSTLMEGTTLGVVITATKGMGFVAGSSTADLALAKDSIIFASSVINKDSVLSTDMTITSATTMVLSSDMLVKAGSILTTGTTFDSGTVINQNITIDGATYKAGTRLAQDITLTASLTLTKDMTMFVDADGVTAHAAAIGSGSMLAAGTVLGLDVTTAANVTLKDSMILKAGSVITSGTEMAKGSVLGESIVITAAATIVTSADMTLKTGSILSSASTFKADSVIGADLVVNQTTLTDSMLLKAGSTLLSGSVLVKGTVLTEDLSADQVDNGNGFGLKAGTVLDVDLTTTADFKLTKDLNMLKDSQLKVGSTVLANAKGENSVSIANKEFTSLADIDVTTLGGAMKAMDTVTAAMTNLDTIRSGLGSTQNQIKSTISNIAVTQINVLSAESSIRDVDFAEESANFAKFNILAQSGSYAMSQANAVQQNVMRLLQ